MAVRSEEEPERIRLWPLEDAEELVRLQVRFASELRDELTLLSGGDFGVVEPIIKKVSDEVSYELSGEITSPQNLRQLAGAPRDNRRLGPWRKLLLAEYEGANKVIKAPEKPTS